MSLPPRTRHLVAEFSCRPRPNPSLSTTSLLRPVAALPAPNSIGQHLLRSTALSDALSEPSVGCSSRVRPYQLDQDLPKPVRVKHASIEPGKQIHYYLTTRVTINFSFAYSASRDLLTGHASLGSASAGPLGLGILEETNREAKGGLPHLTGRSRIIGDCIRDNSITRSSHCWNQHSA